MIKSSNNASILSSFVKKHKQLPDLSNPKWKRRDKLSAMNFMNKGKKGHKQKILGDTLNFTKEEMNMFKNKVMKERLPPAKENNKNTEPSVINTIYNSLSSKRVPIVNKGDLAVKDISKLIQELPIFHESSIISSTTMDPSKAQASFKRDYILKKEEIDEISRLNENINPMISHIANEVLKDNDNFNEYKHKDWRNVMEINSRLGKVDAVQKAFDSMVTEGFVPDRSDYLLLMNSYANSKNIPQCVRVFKEAKSKVSVSSSEFGVLIKALCNEKRLSDAFGLYEEMKIQNIPITQPIFTTLIKGCTLVEDFNRAWHLYEHMKSSVCIPDEITYNHMIGICAKLGEAERAQSLFFEMTRAKTPEGYQMIPLESTYHALLHSLAKRPDYYTQVFEVVSQMTSSGYQPSTRTYNYMLMATAQQGDIVRAKELWKEISPKTRNSYTYLFMLATYSRAPLALSKLHHETKNIEELEIFQNTFMNSKLGLDNEDRVKSGKAPIDIDTWILEEEYKPDASFAFPKTIEKEQLEQLRAYFLDGKNEKILLNEWKQEAQNLFQEVIDAGSSSKGSNPISIDIMNSWIDVLGSFHQRKEMIEFYQSFEKQYGVWRNDKTFCRVLVELNRKENPFIEIEDEYSRPSVILDAALQVYQDFQKFRDLRKYPNNWTELEDRFSKPKWHERGITHGSRRMEYRIMTRYIQILTKHGEVDAACKILGDLIARGHSSIKLARNSKLENNTFLQDTSQKFYLKDPSSKKSWTVPKSGELSDPELKESDLSLSLSSLTSDARKQYAKLKELPKELLRSRKGSGDFSKEDFVCLIEMGKNLQKWDIVEHCMNLLKNK